MKILSEALPVTCPSCGTQISWRYAASEFSCPSCGCGLRLRHRYFRLLYFIGLGLAALAVRALGFEGGALFAGTVLAAWPMFVIVTMLNMRLFPPDVEISGAFQGILHPGAPEDPLRPAEPVVFQIPASAQQLEAGSRVAHWLPSRPTTFEGWAMYIVVISVVVSNLYTLAEPAVYKVFPGFHATRRGPRTFPVTLHIGPRSISIINESTKAWKCSLTVGSSSLRRDGVIVNAGARSDVTYDELLGGNVRHFDTEWLRAEAREQLKLACTDTSGVSRSWQFDGKLK